MEGHFGGGRKLHTLFLSNSLSSEKLGERENGRTLNAGSGKKGEGFTSI